MEILPNIPKYEERNFHTTPPINPSRSTDLNLFRNCTPEGEITSADTSCTPEKAPACDGEPLVDEENVSFWRQWLCPAQDEKTPIHDDKPLNDVKEVSFWRRWLFPGIQDEKALACDDKQLVNGEDVSFWRRWIFPAMSGGSGEQKADGKKTQEKTQNQSKGKKSKHKKSANTAPAAAQEVVPQIKGVKLTLPLTPPEGYLLFSHDVITPEMEEYAAKNLNETPETREKGLRELREILRSDSDLVFTDEDFALLVFLRSKKFDAQKTADFVKLGLNYVESYRYLLERQDPTVLRRVIDTNMVGFLPYRDPRGRAIIYARADKWDPSEIPSADTIFAGVIAVQSAGYNPVNQVNGFMVVLDLKGLTIQQVVAMSRWMIFGTITLQRACPCFLKAFHVINIPPFYKLGWKLVKPLLSEKIRKRFIFHKSSDLSSLYEHLPKEILPVELGGPYEFSNEHWAWDLDNIEKEYYSQLNKNYFISKRKNTAS